MDSHDSFTEDLNPSLGGTVFGAHVANIEMPAYPLAVDRVEVSYRLLRRRDEIVANIFDRDFHAEFLCHRNRLFDLDDRTLPTLLVAHAVARHTRHEQHAARPVSVRVMQTVHESVQPQFASTRVWSGQRFHPMDVVANTCGFQAGFLERGEHLVTVHGAHRFHAFEPGVFHSAEFLEHRALHADGGIHNHLPQIAFGRG